MHYIDGNAFLASRVPQMTAHRTLLVLRHGLRGSRLAQVGLIMLFWLGGEAVARLTGLPVPGGVVGMAVVLVLLASGRLSLFSMRRGADWLLADMLLFFVPAVLAVLNHPELIGLIGLKILAVILVGTVVVMTATALAVDLGWRLMARMEANHARAR
jgi:holin-like protein